MNFYVYENRRAHGHSARVHREECPHCNEGQGNHPGSGTANGQWHGPFEGSDGARARVCSGSWHGSQERPRLWVLLQGTELKEAALLPKGTEIGCPWGSA